MSDSIPDEAVELLEAIEPMLAYYDEHEPERLERKGMERVADAAVAFRVLLDTLGRAPAKKRTPEEVDAGLRRVLEGAVALDGADIPIGRNHPDTSFEMAERMHEHYQDNRVTVYRLVRDAGSEGLTSDEVEVAMGANHSSASSTTTLLRQDGLLKWNGKKRDTRAGNRANVIVVNPDTVVRLGGKVLTPDEV